MKSWGIGGLSRGNLMEGMLAGKDPLSFIPLAAGANERSLGGVRCWVDEWWGNWSGLDLVEVDHSRWFELQGVSGPRLWVPPPAAMATALEVFYEDRIAHPWKPHVFVVPRLMTHMWRKSLSKDAGLVFTVQVGEHFWDASQHKPLIIDLVLPLLHAPNYRGPCMEAGTPEV